LSNPLTSKPNPVGDSMECERQLHELQLLYNLIDKTAASVTAVDSVARASQLELITPFLTTARCSVDIVVALYQRGGLSRAAHHERFADTIEQAYRRLFFAYGDYLNEIKEAFIPPDEIDPTAASVLETLNLTIPPHQPEN